MANARALLEELLVGRPDCSVRVEYYLHVLQNKCSSAKDVAFEVILPLVSEDGVLEKRVRKTAVYETLSGVADPKIKKSNTSHYVCEAFDSWKEDMKKQREKAEREEQAKAEADRRAKENADRRAEMKVKLTEAEAEWDREKIERAKPETRRTDEEDAAAGHFNIGRGRKALLITSENPILLDMVCAYLKQVIGDMNIDYRVVLEPAFRDYEVDGCCRKILNKDSENDGQGDLLLAISSSERRLLPRRRARGGAACAWGMGGVVRLAAA